VGLVVSRIPAQGALVEVTHNGHKQDGTQADLTQHCDFS